MRAAREAARAPDGLQQPEAEGEGDDVSSDSSTDDGAETTLTEGRSRERPASRTAEDAEDQLRSIQRRQELDRKAHQRNIESIEKPRQRAKHWRKRNVRSQQEARAQYGDDGEEGE